MSTKMLYDDRFNYTIDFFDLNGLRRNTISIGPNEY